MKRLLILIAVFVFIISGCFEKSSTKTSQNKKKSQIKKTSQKREIPEGEKPKIIGEAIEKVVQVYFANQAKENEAFKNNDPESALAYQFAFPLKRTIKTKETTKEIDTINELLKGPTKEEKEQGYRTEIHKITLDSLTVEKEIATAKFSGKDFFLEGDRSGPKVRAQIEKTLLQIERIKKVEIYINDEPKFDDLRA
ncbi:MAG: hypothetical protein E3J54_04355 [Actinobacteria bacterium]|nr:MAG: hypothetical protein E3J54_04355 [Actinomycetota bacterium]